MWLMSRGRDYQSNWHAASRLCVSVTIVADSSFQGKFCDLGVNMAASILFMRAPDVFIDARSMHYSLIFFHMDRRASTAWDCVRVPNMVTNALPAPAYSHHVASRLCVCVCGIRVHVLAVTCQGYVLGQGITCVFIFDILVALTLFRNLCQTLDIGSQCACVKRGGSDGLFVFEHVRMHVQM